MKAFDYIFFDCMETLIDLQKLPSIRDYAAWAYNGSGVEERWEDFDEFLRYFLLAKQDISARLIEHAEYEMWQRFMHIVKLSFPDMSKEVMDYTAGRLYENYCFNYKAGSYVKEDVMLALPQLMKQYKLGVVSNFMVIGGIEDMLELHGIRNCFEFVVTSVAVGWKKPHPYIYEKAIEYAGVSPDRIIFIGDDFINDYITPSELGMTPFYLDRFGKHPELNSRIMNFQELQELVLNVEKNQ